MTLDAEPVTLDAMTKTPEMIAPPSAPAVGGVLVEPKHTLETLPISELPAYVAWKLGIKTDLAKAILPVALDQIATLDKKQQDYGPGNLIEFGADGVLVRLSDKRSRIVNLRKQKANILARTRADESMNLKPQNEAESDSWLDLSNYSLIGYAMIKKIWPKQ